MIVHVCIGSALSLIIRNCRTRATAPTVSPTGLSECPTVVFECLDHSVAAREHVWIAPHPYRPKHGAQITFGFPALQHIFFGIGQLALVESLAAFGFQSLPRQSDHQV